MHESRTHTNQSKIQNRVSGTGESKIDLIATDIDGTLLNSENTIPATNLRALHQAIDRGIRVALATARKHASALAVAHAIGVPCALIAHNGARMWDWQGRELRHLTVDHELARSIAAFAEQHELPLIMTIDEIDYGSAAYWPSTAGQRSADRRIARLHSSLAAPPTRIIVVGSDAIDQVFHTFSNAHDSIVLHRYYSRDGAIESAMVTHPRATKEDALADLIDRIGLDRLQVLALGDAAADAAMLRWAGVGVAMGNAMPEARAAADWIAPSHDEAGFAAAVARFVLEGH